jgi:DNA repair ATPase RecN
MMPIVLTLLRIKNLALVEELEWHIGSGFIAVTGETGAGKSIIIGALQLLLGCAFGRRPITRSAGPVFRALLGP